MVKSNQVGITVFAYGSNMLTARMKARAPSSQLIGTAFLDKFALRWNKRSQDGSGKCSIEETGNRDDFVWGVIFQLDDADKKKLDNLGGLGRGYGERNVIVVSHGNPLRAVTYYATSVDPHVKPYDWYKDLVVAGAREHALPEQYIQALKSVSVIRDLNKDRVARERGALE